MSKFLLNTGLSGIAAAAALLATAPVHADAPSVNLVNDPNLIHVSGGCGPNGWRGQWGHCHFYGGGGWRGGWWGPGPYIGPGPGPYWHGGCGPYRYRGPHGHCRS
jgi:hypothetical protein